MLKTCTISSQLRLSLYSSNILMNPDTTSRRYREGEWELPWEEGCKKYGPDEDDKKKRSEGEPSNLV